MSRATFSNSTFATSALKPPLWIYMLVPELSRRAPRASAFGFHGGECARAHSIHMR